jgi:hypothetical protein
MRILYYFAKTRSLALDTHPSTMGDDVMIELGFADGIYVFSRKFGALIRVLSPTCLQH